MAKKEEQKLDYAAEVKKLRQNGPERLYFLWGPEDYLRERFLETLKSVCLPEGEDSFSFRRLEGPELDETVLAEAVNALPFLTERSFVEVRGVDWNKAKNAEALVTVLGDVPDCCTVALVQGSAFEPDGRLKQTKALRAAAQELKFTRQPQSALIQWIARRFEALGKRVERTAAERLVFVSGDLMNRLIPEIEKIAAYTQGDVVTVQEVEAVAHHLPEAVVFKMTDCLASRNNDAALRVLDELLADKNNEPIMILAVVGMQMRRLFAARLAADQKLGERYVMDVCKLSNSYVAGELMRSARGFSTGRLRRALELCAETDHRMKSSGEDPVELLKELVLRIAAGEPYA